jgi:NhaA family Na+:H+ antiporter
MVSTDSPPGTSPIARRAVARLLDPVQRFLALDAASGILLLIATALALAWANAPWRASYQALLHTPAGVSLGGLAFERSLHFWINEGLMTIFFFVVGLEIRRELHAGSLSSRRQAVLPLAAAIGGMVVPAAIYAALNAGRATAGGWGIPMATDIAFSLGLLALLGARVAPALRVFLLALAVIDDIGAILVIAVFYSATIVPWGFAVAAAGGLVTVALQRAGMRRVALYVPPAVAVWAGFLIAGVHPTLAGVVVGLLTPARPWQGVEDVSPVDRLLAALHGWVSYAIMPVFALANAGVALDGADLAGDGAWAMVGVVLGLVVGKPVGILLASWLAVRAGWAALPPDTRWSGLSVIGVVAGVGFTMSLFIAGLAFADGAILATSKLAVLVASATAAALTLGLGRALLPRYAGT